MSVMINGTSGVTTPGIANSEGYTGDGLTIAAGAPAGALQIDTSGNLGLGVTPSAWGGGFQGFQLHNLSLMGSASDGTARVLNNAYYDGVGYKYKISSTAANMIALGGGGGMQFYTAPSGTAGNPITFTQAMTLDASGNLLVGTTSGSGSAFEVVKSTSSVARFKNTNNTSGVSCMTWQLGSNTNNTGSYFLVAQEEAVANRMFIFGNGNVVNQNNSYGALSDEKLKENIVDATPKLEKLTQVRVVNYNLIGETQKQIGVIAQELEQIFPSMVEESPDRDAEGNDLGTTTKSVKYSVFVPMLIKAIQEQQAMITELKARIEQLEAK